MDNDKTDIRGWGRGDACFALAGLVIKLLPVVTLKFGHMPSKAMALGPEIGKQNIIVCVYCYFLHFTRYYKKEMHSDKTWLVLRA